MTRKTTLPLPKQKHVLVSLALTIVISSTAVGALHVTTMKNLLNICSHIQNPELYSSEWADACIWGKKEERLLASRDLLAGEILSLYPVHAIGKHHELLFDADRDGAYFLSSGKRSTAYRIELTDGMFIDVNPNRPLQPGWLGHLATKGHETCANCAVVLLVPPLCALVATSYISLGSELTVMSIIRPQLGKVLQYSQEISEFQSYISMAYPQPKPYRPKLQSGVSLHDEDLDSRQHEFYQINHNYPGLVKLHSNPDILVVENFLTADECDQLMAKALPHLKPCLVKQAQSGLVERDPSRTSTNTNVPRREVPSIVAKILDLLGSLHENRLEILQVLRYTTGQEFWSHTDGFPGPITACGFVNSGRLVTIFCYLNDVEKGGTTKFPFCNLEIVPRKGTVVLHFPNTVDLEEDTRTEHEGSMAWDEKWMLVTWLWKDALIDMEYDESNLPCLGGNII